MKASLIAAGIVVVFSSMVDAATTSNITTPQTVRWDFSGVFDTTWGTGSGLPGLVNGASISGSIEAASDFVFHLAYHKFDGDLTIYRSPSAILRYTATSPDGSYSHSLTEVHALITQKDVGNAYRVSFTAPFFQLSKDVTGSEITDPTFQNFADAMARGTSDGTGHITIANGFWNNSNLATITSISMTTVPEPSSTLLLGLALAGLVHNRRRFPDQCD